MGDRRLDKIAFMASLPEPSFEFLVATLGMQAQMHLGMLVPDPSQAPEVNLPMARHMIDLLAMMQDKTKGNLSMEEARMLENTLTELRFRYVQASEQAGKAAAAVMPETAETPQA
jgi:Domain of unknown function (DUF1844)